MVGVQGMQTKERRQAQFELERCLRQRVLSSSKENRQGITAVAYEELFTKFPDHSTFEAKPQDRQRAGSLSAGLIAPLIPGKGRILEVGCGLGDTLRALQQRGYDCVGTEASGEMVSLCQQAGDLKVVPGIASRLEFSDNSFRFVYCQQVLEHLHPEDLPGFFAEALRVLQPGGVLSVETPNSRTGPQDISRGFTPTAQGLHLKEWTVSELVQQFKAAGFQRIRGLLVSQFFARRSRLIHRLTRVPAGVKYIQDLLLGCIPGLRPRTIAGRLLGLNDIFLFGQKP